MPTIPRTALVLGALAVLASHPATAAERAYVGTWASQPLRCWIDQSLPAAPLVMTRTGYDQHETHCRFTSG